MKIKVTKLSIWQRYRRRKDAKAQYKRKGHIDGLNNMDNIGYTFPLKFEVEMAALYR